MPTPNEIIDTFEQQLAFAMRAYQQRLADIIAEMKAMVAVTIEDADIPPHSKGFG
jgi:hypothetical protein